MKRFKSQDRWIHISVVFLTIFGIVMIGSASIGAATTYGSGWAIKNIFKQIGFCFIGFFLMFLVSRTFSTRSITKKTSFFLFVTTMVSLFICLIWEAEKGAKAWIRLPFNFTIQPSEFGKIAMIIIVAYLLVMMPKEYKVKSQSMYRTNARYNDAVKRHRFWCFYLPASLIIVEVFTVAFIQNDTGTAAITALICLVCLFSARDKIYAKFQNFMMLLCGGALLISPFIYTIFISGYMADRFSSWLNPLVDVTGTSLQISNALIAITNGSYFGVGIGNSTQKFGYIPEAHNDFISSIIFEELGLVGLAFILIPYAIIILRLMKYAATASDSRTTIVLSGISSYFFFHLFINLGGVSGLIPMTGVPLLFISSGGSSTLSAFIAIGISQALISQDRKLKQMVEQPSYY